MARTTDLEISWAIPALSPPQHTRLSKPAFARLELLVLQSGNSRAAILRELISRGWKEAFGEDMNAPF